MRVVLVDNAEGRLVIDYGKQVYLHASFKKWSVGRVKKYRDILDATLAGLARAGIKAVYATPWEWDTKAQKMIKMFGFTERNRALGLVVMERRI